MTAPIGLWLGTAPLVLASGSAARRALLESAGIPFRVQPAAIDERSVETGMAGENASPGAVAQALAEAKAKAVSADNPGAYVLGADQTLALGNDVFHKPADLEAAARHLEAFSGRIHQLFSAAAIVRDGAVVFATMSRADLSVRRLKSDFIAAYLAAAGPGICGSVGAYQLEGLGSHLFERIEGDQATIMGLPLLPLLEGLRDLGLLIG